MKKIRVTIPEDIWDIIKIDQEDYGMNNNKFCNYILEKLNFNKKIETENLLQSQGRTYKKIIQFDLNVSNKEIYYDILKTNGVEIEAEYFRELFEIYCAKFKYQRELFIYEDRLKTILDAIKSENKIKIKNFSKILDVEPIFIRREANGNENFLFCYVDNLSSYQNYKLKETEVISILPDKIKKRDKKLIENLRKKYDPFSANTEIIKVKLTSIGDSLLKTFTEYRPKLIKKEGTIYFFEASKEQAKIYFAGFLKEVEILEPLSLREDIKNEYLETLKNYNK